MKLVHLSDTHLGYRGQGIERHVEDPWRPGIPVRQREADLMLGLIRAVDRILASPLPDVVVHSGNLFETAHPSAHLLDFAMTQVERLAEAGIPIVLLEGSHDTPRDRSQGHILRLFAHLPRVHVVCDKPERIEVGSLLLHAMPPRALLEGTLPEKTACDPAFHNVLVTHGVADGHPYYRTGRPTVDIDISRCATWYEYIALGHCHRFGQIPDSTTAFYAGATAMVTNGDFRLGGGFGFNCVTFDDTSVSVEREILDSRPMHAYGLDDAAGLSSADVLMYLERQSTAIPPDGAYCQVVVEHLDPLVRRELSIKTVEELFGGAAGLVVNLRVREQHWEAVQASLLEGGDVATRFRQLVSQMDGDVTFHTAVEQLGAGLLARAAEMVVHADLDAGAGESEADAG